MPLSVRRASTAETDPRRAMQAIATGLAADDADAVIFFCSPDYPLDVLGPEIESAFRGPVIGCTSSGQIDARGYRSGGISAVALSGGAVRCEAFTIAPLSDYQREAGRIGEIVCARREAGRASRRFGVLLVDGLSRIEEQLATALYESLDDLPLVGGSASDDLRFERTHVFVNGRFLEDAAVLAVFETELPFVPFSVQHFTPTDVRFVITDADTERRTIYELNGEPAAGVYAEAVGVDVPSLGPEVFARHPLMLRMGDEYYARALARAGTDGSLELFCAVERGLVVTLGAPGDPRGALDTTLTSLRERLDGSPLILAFDCILRRVEFEAERRIDEISELLLQHEVFGFSCYGEQFNGLHMNQSLTGVALGRR